MPPIVYKPTEKVGKPIGLIPTERFTPSYYEWLLKHAEQIIKEKVVVDTKGTIYQVPEGFILYITSAFINARAHVADAGADGYIYVNKKKIIPVTGQGGATAWAHVEIFNEYPHPVIVKGKELIEVESTRASWYCWGGFTGFLVKIKDIPAF